MSDDYIMGFGKEVAHWLCKCGQPNAKDRDLCVACGEIPTEKRFRKKRVMPDSLRGRKRTTYY